MFISLTIVIIDYDALLFVAQILDAKYNRVRLSANEYKIDQDTLALIYNDISIIYSIRESPD